VPSIGYRLQGTGYRLETLQHPPRSGRKSGYRVQQEMLSRFTAILAIEPVLEARSLKEQLANVLGGRTTLVR
jgi:hypothetical protein